MSFFVIATILTIVSILILIIPILRPRSARMDTESMNAAILQEQILELEQDLKEDNITREQFDSASNDLKLNYANSLSETKQSVISNKDKILGIVFTATIIPLISFITYHEIKPESTSVTSSNIASEQPTIEQMVTRLEKKLEDKPDDVDGWLMLARSYDVVGRKTNSVNAYRKALSISPEDSWIMAQLGFVLSEINGNLSGEPVELFKKALEIAPKNMDARFLLGKHHFEQQEYKKAAEHWEFLLNIVNAADAVPVRNALNAARARLGLEPVAAPKAGIKNFIDLTIIIDPKIKDSVSKDAVVFVFARAKSGPNFPLAAQKTIVSELPATLRLDDSMAMMGDFTLSKYMPAVVFARISKSGTATPQVGDYIGSAEILKLGEKVTINISEEIK